MLRQFQQQKLLQKLSPQQIQLIKLLEVPSVEMTERVMQEVDANPALELGENAVTDQNDDPLYDTGDGGNNDDFTFDDYATDDDIPDYKTRQTGGESALDNWKDWLPVTADVTLNDVLLEQLNLQELSEEDRKVATFII
ncbi:MAG: RNA polymerase sigma-54 factor, partial [Bacteroidales bacterium]|nr:RNA polymerase sigma-54 factor [Bacteroidales bacterium]